MRYWPLCQRWTAYMTEKLSVTIPEACAMTGLGRSTIYRLFDDGSLPRRKVGKRSLILLSDLRAYIEGLADDAA